MSTLLSLIVAGIVSGSLYALTALSVVAVYKVARVLNFAQGATAALVAYVAWDILHSFQISLYLVLIIAIVAGSGAGLLTEAIAVRPLRKHGLLVPVLATLGLSLAIDGTIQTIWGSAPRPYPLLLGGSDLRFLGATITRSNALIVAIAFAAMLILWLFYDKTRIGTMIRATYSNVEAAESCGINTGRMTSIGWSVAGALMGLAGVLASIQTYLAPSLNQSLLILSLIAVAAGGFQSLPGAAAGGFIVGIFQSLFAGYGSPGFSEPLLLGGLFILLVVWPRGIFGGIRSRSKTDEHASLLPASFESFTLPLKLRWVMWIGFAVLAFVVASFASDSLVVGMSVAAAYTLVVLSFVLVIGYSGQISVGQGAIALVGAYASTIVAHSAGFSFLPALAVGGIAGMVFGGLVAWPLMRVSGFSFAIATVALAVAVPEVLLNAPVKLTGGYEGLPVPPISLFGHQVLGTRGVLYVTLVIVVIVLVIVQRFVRTYTVLQWKAVRDSEPGSRACGISVHRQRIFAFVVASLLAGLGGGLFAYVGGIVTTSDFGFNASVQLQFGAILGGLLSVYGSAIGAMFVVLVPIVLSGQGALGEIAYGVVAYLVLLILPGGVSDLAARVLHRGVPKLSAKQEHIEEVLGIVE